MIKSFRSSMVALAWGALLSEFTILLFHEKVVFDTYFTEVWQYVMLGACAFSTFLLVAVISKFMDWKFLAVSCFLTFVVVAMAWFTIGWNLPPVSTTTGCNLWICGIPGQLLVILLMISVNPPLLIEFTRRTTNRQESKDLKITPMTVMIAGGMTSFSGFAAYTTYVATPILLAPIAGMGAIAVIFMATGGKIDFTIDTLDAKGVKVDLILSIRDLMTSVLISASSFSMLSSSSFSFKLLGEIGISMIIFGIVLHVVTKLRPPGDALHLLEGNLIALLLASTWMLARFLNEGMAITRASGLPEFIIGFSVAYILARMVNAAIGVEPVKSVPTFMMHEARKRGSTKFSVFFYMLLMFAVAIIHLSPNSGENELIYQAGFVISVISMLLWTVSRYAHGKRLSS